MYQFSLPLSFKHSLQKTQFCGSVGGHSFLEKGGEEARASQGGAPCTEGIKLQTAPFKLLAIIP